MRGTALIAAVMATGVTLGTTSCGQPTAGAIGGTAARKQASCVAPKLTMPGRTFTLTNADNGKSYCLAPGTGVFVFLHGTPVVAWAPIHPSSAAIQRRPSGEMMLARGVTGGFFVAVRTGQAELTSARPPCRAGSVSASPAAAHCTASSFFSVRLVIRASS